MNLGDMLKQLRDAWDIEDQRREAYESAKRFRDGLERDVLRAMDESGQEKAGAEGISVTKASRLTAPIADWDAFCKWCVAHDRTDMISKRANVRPLEELVKSNDGEFPPGVSLDVIPRLNKRRTK